MDKTETVAQRVTEALDGRSVRWLSEETGIAYTTLNRRFKDGSFTVPELFKIAATVAVSPAHLVGEVAA